MASFNKVILIGNMTADPELKQTAAGVSVCSFSIAVNRRFAKTEQGQQTVDFINIVTWRQSAEFVSRYFKKGNPILVCGQIQTRTWTDTPHHAVCRWAAHHGSRSSNTEELINEAKPHFAVISCGEDNSYGHPHMEALQNFRNAGSEIFMTKDTGAIMIHIKDGEYTIDTWR